MCSLTKVLVKSLCELVQGRWHLQPLVQHTTLTLDANIFGPFHKSMKIALGWKRTSNSKLLRPLLEQWVYSLLCNLLPLQYHQNNHLITRSKKREQQKHRIH